MHEWIQKMWYACTMEYYCHKKRIEIMSFAATWMDLEIIIQSEVSQTKTNIIQPEDEEASKIFQNILTEPQHA